jgi:Tol biopolymer transport system component
VVFHSNATNLVTGDTNGKFDVFVRDRTAQTTRRVSVSSTGTEANQPSQHGKISADGRYVAFESWATNLTGSDTNGALDVFVRDLTLGSTRLVSETPGGGSGNGESHRHFISAGSQVVVFDSVASDLVPGDTNHQRDLFVGTP